MSGYVYSFRCTANVNVCKIGSSIDPHRRLRSIQGMRGERMMIEDVILCYDHLKVERYLHNHIFKPYRDPTTRGLIRPEYYLVDTETVKRIFKEVRNHLSEDESSDDLSDSDCEDSDDYVVDRIISHELRNGGIYYRTRWDDGSVTTEPLKSFIFDEETGEVSGPLEDYWDRYPSSRPTLQSLAMACGDDYIYSFDDE